MPTKKSKYKNYTANENNINIVFIIINLVIYITTIFIIFNFMRESVGQFDVVAMWLLIPKEKSYPLEWH